MSSTYQDGIILEALLESLHDIVLVLLLNDLGSRRKDAVCRLALLRLGSLAQLEQYTEQLGPLVV